MDRSSRTYRRSPERFARIYSSAPSEVQRAIELEVYGANIGVNGYTTVEQAEALAQSLNLRPGSRLLDLGTGLGWPGLYLVQTTGCDAVLTDIPEPGLRRAERRADDIKVVDRCDFLLASGQRLPFRARSFDAIVHTDTL